MTQTKRRKALFVINPIAGKGDRQSILTLIDKLSAGNQDFEIEKIVWNKREESALIIEKIKGTAYDRIIVVGGDGTLNLVAEALLYSDTKLAIIPVGSGNGLARHLNIPLNAKAAYKLAFSDYETSIDVGLVNNNIFLCTTGLGFDAAVAHEFARAGDKRGFQSYVKKSIQSYFQSKSGQYELMLNNERLNVNAFLLTVANTNQYGNNAYIAPHAMLRDGELNLVIVKAVPFLVLPFTLAKLFRKKLHTSKYVEMFSLKRLQVCRNAEQPFHFDGEPKMGGTQFTFSVKHRALRVVSHPVN